MGHPFSQRSKWRAAVLLAIVCTVAHAQLPAPFQLPKAAAPPEAVAPTSPAPPDTATRLAAVRDTLAQLDRPGAVADGAPPGTPDAEIADRIRLLRQLERSLAQRIDDEAQHAELVRARQHGEARAEEWRGFAEPPPYSLPFLDAQEESVNTAEQQIATIDSREAVFNRLADRLQRRLRDSETELRQATEQVEKARDDRQSKRARWLRDLAKLKSDEAAASLDAMQQSLINIAEEKGAAAAQLRLAKAQLAAARTDTRFSKEDLDRLDARLAGEQKALEAELDRASATLSNRRRAAADAAKRLSGARGTPPAAAETQDAYAARVATLDREADLAQKRVENANMALEGAKLRIALVDYERKAWSMRYELAQAKDLEKESAAYENMVASLAALQAWNEYQKQQLDTTNGLLATIETKLRGAPPSDVAPLRELRDVYVQRELILRSSLSAAEPLERLLTRWRANVATSNVARSLSERLGDAWIVTRLWAKRLWAFELFSVEDSFETAEGRKVIAQRSVTIGKTIGAVLLIAIGYWLCLKIAKLAGWMSIRVFRQSPAWASVVRRWTLALLVTLLVASSLLAVQIPLTVFAFLGGALAIGVGFGAQNLLKNLMSGVMLLIEKPLRVGDLIEFGGVRGRVTSIGFRASIVRTADGIETHIPNSTFIESNVTNLTYSSIEIRQQISVGVMYGADPATVRKVLLAVADDHRAVLRTPAPAAYFDDFGDDAQKFRLTYWIDAAPDRDTAEVATELRELILQRLTAAGIRIPFPQRELHVSAPVQVEVVNKTGPT